MSEQIIQFSTEAVQEIVQLQKLLAQGAVKQEHLCVKDIQVQFSNIIDQDNVPIAVDVTLRVESVKNAS